jgi:hypothetical protein
VGNIYVTDRLNHRIQKWALEQSRHRPLLEGMATDRTLINCYPNNLFVDNLRILFLTRELSYSKWTPDAITGTTVAGGNGMGSNANQLYIPNNFIVDTTGNIYIADGLK